MNYETARSFLMQQGNPEETDTEALLIRLRQGYPPLPTQLSTLLQALDVVFEALQGTEILERQLVYALYVLAIETQQQFQRGQARGVQWPAGLEEELFSLAEAVKKIFAGNGS
ncbi:Dethiobiotin synthetase [Thermocoleostomius sinensis]|uniref:Dethiobiotin synthetase n=1 Tax=Thermocoleostomius sinensis A174 TaxID=2016057 RepID=A0A9E8Z9W9_9CYAN|nr:Dethiobiotin synthetase [Thermocoleostomius sinensis]WAL59244.1 Dethiobiotin synthetase [Thermocoleostomius sinensis A174]